MSVIRVPVATAVAVAIVLAAHADATAGVLGGVVQKVTGNEVVVQYGREGKVKVFLVPLTAKIYADEQPAKITAIEAGSEVTVYTTTGGSVYKIRVKGKSRPPAVETKPDVSRVLPEVLPGEGGKTPEEDAEAWSQFRGPDRMNRSTATGLLAAWPEGGPRVAEVYRGLGSGYSTVSFQGDRLFTMGTSGNDEVVLAFDRDEPARKLWSVRNGSVFQDSTGDGPRGTPSVDGEFVYALGANGDLACIEVATGEATWRKNVLREFAGANITWGISESPLVDGNRVIVTPGGQTATMAAIEKKSGRTLWKSVFPGRPQAAYASAVVQQAGPVRQYVNFTSGGVIGVHAETGTPLWGDDTSSNGTANCPTPIPLDRAVFSASGYGTGAALVRLTPSLNGKKVQATAVYKVRELVNHHGGMVLVDGYVYGTNDNAFLCVDVADGEVVWRDRSVGKGSLTYAEGHLYVVGEDGEIALVEATAEGYREKGRFRHRNRSNKPLWAHPVVHDGRLYVRDQDTLTAYDVKAK